ncbi:MAG: hypothetical protein CL893_04625 [Dehalococcoidia bacterium]|nr:hypothetical protein [Dehalococcoidia bacterium]
MKSLDKLLNSNLSEIGFFNKSNKSSDKLNILGVSKSQSDLEKYSCDAYISTDTVKKSIKSIGKYFDSNDTEKSIENFDFIILENTKEVKINLLIYEIPICIQINHQDLLSEQRLATFDSFDFDFFIYKIEKDFIFNFQEVITIKERLNSIRSNWFIYLDNNNLTDEDLQYIYDLGFVGLIVDLDKLKMKDFNKIKASIKKIEEKKNGKI